MFKDIKIFNLRVIFNKYKKYFWDKYLYAEIGSPCWSRLSNLEYFFAFLPLMLQDSWLFKIIFIQLIKSRPNPNFRRICKKKQWLTESNAFSISAVTRKPSSESYFDISKISEITFPLSLINLFLTYTLWLEEIRKGNTYFILVERTKLIVFISLLSIDIGLHLLINLLSLSFFPTF